MVLVFTLFGQEVLLLGVPYPLWLLYIIAQKLMICVIMICAHFRTSIFCFDYAHCKDNLLSSCVPFVLYFTFLLFLVVISPCQCFYSLLFLLSKALYQKIKHEKNISSNVKTDTVEVCVYMGM